MKRVKQAAKNYFIPHEGNDHKPHILRARTVAFVCMVALVAESAFVFGAKYIITQSKMFGIVEANALGIPVIGVVDTNNSPLGVNYVIPGNDDSNRAIRLYARGVADAVLEGRSEAIGDILGEGEEFVEMDEVAENSDAV